jgi:hypothetical protein
MEMLEPTFRAEPIMELHSKGRLLSLSSNNMLGWKGITMTDTLAYYNSVIIMAGKVFWQRPMVALSVSLPSNIRLG